MINKKRIFMINLSHDEPFHHSKHKIDSSMIEKHNSIVLLTLLTIHFHHCYLSMKINQLGFSDNQHVLHYDF